MKKTTDQVQGSQSVEIRQLTDPTSVQNQIEVFDQDFISLSRKKFLAKRVLITLENIKLGNI